uniref:Zinc finger CHCC-type domain-containing protein n=1 Tax=Helicotheca tamesis TaxID=374047 RepID=A0A7S2E237_9STRA|mmetsp:Transcript_11878/g.16415  ORF Transcript_11878/g.16415 Transcript_11878/m.16415 type:complete len:128 (+) Transcript_11878:124-507(+)|eukprot:CAMPEP_0185728722 /NCGR_PEP_ID=MMETSP1171-20130828/4083_1 /TAXON_ID=374046 /ORGANISM="Helicotheca tamensis, Strain CCMP826" /LENGTH=127 /DNA_ID=CAMNT_0028397461 /DNA_START=77 /DNA_END=460 /DNA_ORIENTATION=+
MMATTALRQAATSLPKHLSSRSPIAYRTFSSVPQTADEAARILAGEDKSRYKLTRQESPYLLGKHRSNALELVEKQPVIEVEGPVAVCDGGGGPLGHPLEYINIANRNGEPVSCIYCGLKYVQKGGH